MLRKDAKDRKKEFWAKSSRETVPYIQRGTLGSKGREGRKCQEERFQRLPFKVTLQERRGNKGSSTFPHQFCATWAT